MGLSSRTEERFICGKLGSGGHFIVDMTASSLFGQVAVYCTRLFEQGVGLKNPLPWRAAGHRPDSAGFGSCSNVLWVGAVVGAESRAGA